MNRHKHRHIQKIYEDTFEIDSILKSGVDDVDELILRKIKSELILCAYKIYELNSDGMTQTQIENYTTNSLKRLLKNE